MNATPTHPVSRLKDSDMQAAPAALLRAAQRAREVAARTGTPLIVAQDGVLIEMIVRLDMIAATTPEKV